MARQSYKAYIAVDENTTVVSFFDADRDYTSDIICKACVNNASISNNRKNKDRTVLVRLFVLKIVMGVIEETYVAQHKVKPALIIINSQAFSNEINDMSNNLSDKNKEVFKKISSKLLDNNNNYEYVLDMCELIIELVNNK